MSRRRRAVLMLMAAGGAGVLAVSVVGGYSSSVAETYGELRQVVVLARTLEEGQVISGKTAATALQVRSVPRRFVPAGALSAPEQAVGLELAGTLPAGSYLTGPSLRPPGSDRPKRPRVGRGKHAVELAVSGAGALTGAGKVDVLVTTENGRGGGRTFVAARAVRLIAVGRTGQSDIGPGLTEVTLGLSRPQAIRLIDAQSFARRITVLPRSGG